jgi:hypothetical protein
MDLGGTLATVTEFMASGSLKKVLVRKQRLLDRRKWVTLAMDATIVGWSTCIPRI